MKSDSNVPNVSSLIALLKHQEAKWKTPVKDHLDWTNIKRTSQIIKQKVKNESCTVDEKFDELKGTLLETEKKLRSLKEFIDIYCETLKSMLDDSKQIGQLFVDVFDPNNNFHYASSYDNFEEMKESLREMHDSPKSKTRILEEEYDLWKVREKYSRYIEEVELSVSKSVTALNYSVSEKVSELLECSMLIKKCMKRRCNALIDYDKTYNAHENLIIKQSTEDLTLKQSQQIHNLERKLDEYDILYKVVNNLLKDELPVFFNLVNKILTCLVYQIYYDQLTIVKAINDGLNVLRDIFGSSNNGNGSFSYAKIVDEFRSKNQVVIDLANRIEILNPLSFHRKMYSPIESSRSPHNPSRNNVEYCKVLYPFHQQQPGDLTISPGDIIKLIDRKTAWWKGDLNGTIGTFPGNYVQLVTKN